MSSFEERHRKEEDPFAKEAPQKEDALLQALAVREREEEAARKVALLLSAMAAQKEPAPHVQAELPADGPIAADSAERLFQHYAEQRDAEEGEDEEQQTTSQPDVRHGSREVWRKSKDIADVIQDGMDGDFVADSAIVAADLDTHPGGAQGAAPFDDGVDAWTGQRRRRAELGLPASPLAKEDAQPAAKETSGKESQ